MWILIMIFTGSGTSTSAAIHSQEFNFEEQCTKAAKEFINIKPYSYGKFEAICVHK